MRKEILSRALFWCEPIRSAVKQKPSSSLIVRLTNLSSSIIVCVCVCSSIIKMSYYVIAVLLFQFLASLSHSHTHKFNFYGKCQMDEPQFFNVYSHASNVVHGERERERDSINVEACRSSYVVESLITSITQCTAAWMESCIRNEVQIKNFFHFFPSCGNAKMIINARYFN